MPSWMKSLEQLLFPAMCLICGTRRNLKPGYDACCACLADLPRQENACEQCGEPLGALPGSGALCGQCLADPPAFDRSWCLGPYTDPLAALIRGLKFQQRLENGRLLGQLLGRYMAARDYGSGTTIIPVPLHPWRLANRGFNQAAEIGRWAALEAQLRCQPGIVRRVRNTPAQTGLAAARRRKNLRGAFTCLTDLGGCHVAIVDDVMTTGSTAASLAATLKAAGCTRVEVWCCARASLRPHGA